MAIILHHHSSTFRVAGLVLGLLVGFTACTSDKPVGGDGGSNQNQNQDLTDAAPPDAAPPDAAVREDPHLAENLGIDTVEVYQAVQIPIFADGAPVSAGALNSPVVADRDAMVRIYVTPGTGWSARQVTAELHVGPAGVAPFDPTDPGAAGAFVASETLTVSAASNEADPGSTFNITVPGSHVQVGYQWSVRLLDPTGAAPAVGPGTPHEARLPADGQSTTPLPARSDDGGLHIVLVPMQYDRDGSGRLPDTSPTQLAIIEELLLHLYPTAHVQLTVHDPIPWDDALTWSGNFDFGDLNEYLSDLRVSENALQETYYYGLVSPDDTFSDYCGSSCVTGQSYVVSSPENADFRAGSGLGFPGERWAWTLAHEVGHSHGRNHAPCDVSSSDANYPYGGGSIGVYGIDMRPNPMVLLDPATYSDMMGYCDERWISDYNYQALWDRMIAVNALIPPPPPRPGVAAPSPDATPRPYRFLRLGRDGSLRWGRSVRLRTPSRSDEVRTVRFLDRHGRTLSQVYAAYLRHAHGGSASLLVPEPAPQGATAVAVGGQRIPLPAP